MNRLSEHLVVSIAVLCSLLMFPIVIAVIFILFSIFFFLRRRFFMCALVIPMKIDHSQSEVKMRYTLNLDVKIASFR